MGIIYKATCKPTGQSYIGYTKKSLPERMYQHFYGAFVRGNKGKFCNAIRKYGKDSFIWEIIEEAEDTILPNLEVKHIEEHDTYRLGLNSTMGGDGYVLSDAERIEFSQRFSGTGNPMFGKTRVLTDEWRRKIGAYQKGRPKSDAQRRKMSANNSRFWRGKKLTDEHRHKMCGRIPWNKGMKNGRIQTTKVGDTG